jgi:hypothetical protein
MSMMAVMASPWRKTEKQFRQPRAATNLALGRFNRHLSTGRRGGKYSVRATGPWGEDWNGMSMESPDLYALEGDFAGADAPGDAPRRGLMGIAETRLMGLAEDGKAEIVRNFADLVGLVQDIAREADNFGIAPIAGNIRKASAVLEDWHDALRDKPVGELLDDGRDLIRARPEIAIGVATLAGFLAARLLKSGLRD